MERESFPMQHVRFRSERGRRAEIQWGVWHVQQFGTTEEAMQEECALIS